MKLALKKALDLYLGGLFIIFLQPIVRLVGKILGRNHDPIPKGDITIIKLLGGGSLVIGLPALYAIKEKYPNQKLQLLTTKSIAPFARTFNLFDEILILDDSSLFTLVSSSLKILIKLFRTDTMIDWEVYSRLTTIFSLFTCARNRIGFYREDVKSRKFFNTHLIFFNLYYGSWHFYEELSRLIGATIPDYKDVRKKFLETLPEKKSEANITKIGIGHACSDLSKERMLSSAQWAKVFEKNIDKSKKYEIYFWGVPKDGIRANAIIDELKKLNLPLEFKNRCGETNLQQSINEMVHLDEFWGIDSALIHYARLMGIKTQGFYGPTAPISLLKQIPIEEKINYAKVPCSPCVHVTEKPPCEGKNICIQNLFT